MSTSPVAADTRTNALDALHRLTGRPDAEFHDGQLEAISALVDDRRRALVVQRTGWGKSAVYFIATALLRQAGAGPTLLVSPLIALMRDQVAAAERPASVPWPSTRRTSTPGTTSGPGWPPTTSTCCSCRPSA